MSASQYAFPGALENSKNSGFSRLFAAAFLMRHHLALADREAKEKRRLGNGREKTNHGE